MTTTTTTTQRWKVPAPLDQLLFDPKQASVLSTIILLLELVFGVLIIQRVAYTEIDWIAYMQEVGGYLDGERDYIKLKGDTGPLVYPAGFVYLYSALRYLTDDGTNVRKAQYNFLGFYLALLAVVHRIYIEVGRRCNVSQSNNQQSPAHLPNYLLILLSLSKRIHSIFMLRLFNDGLAMLLLYVGIYFMIRNRFRWASLCLTLAVSIKMNILLFFPAYILILMMNHSVLQALSHVIGMVIVQGVLGLPFLLHHPANYINKAFEFSRVFFYKWTVNLKLLPEPIFLHPTTSLLLLVAHLIILVIVINKYSQAVGGIINVIKHGLSGLFMITNKSLFDDSSRQLSPHFIVSVMFLANFVGVIFARSLHYQFYVWYFHTLPYVISLTTSSWPTNSALSARDVLTIVTNVCILAMIEVSWNVFPAQWWSSSILIAAHLYLLVRVLAASVPQPHITKRQPAKVKGT